MEQKSSKPKLKTIIILLSIVVVAVVILAIIGTIVFVSNKRIKLTSENYSDYLQIDITGGPAGDVKAYGEKLGKIQFYNQSAYTDIICSVDVKGLSPNYIYEDVKVEVHFYTKEDFYVYDVTDNFSKDARFTKTDETFNVDKTFVIECDTSGNMKAGQEHYYKRDIARHNYSRGFSTGIIISSKDIIKDLKVTGTLKPIK